jgi:hypothetical protein
VEGGSVRLQVGDQFLGPVNEGLIRYSFLYLAVALNCIVDLLALFAHGRPFQAEQTGHLCDGLQSQGSLVPRPRRLTDPEYNGHTSDLDFVNYTLWKKSANDRSPSAVAR